MELALLGTVAVVLIVLAAAFSSRLGIAAPLLLVALGAGLSFVPDAPEIPIEPEWILVLVLPPLLYSAAVNVPLVDFRRNLNPIVGLGVFAVVLSAFASGFVLWLLLPDLDFAAAVALGAVISPTDAVAATAIAKRIGLPRRLVTVLEGESLINDASALVLLRTAIAAMGGLFSLGDAVLSFGWAVVGGGGIGLALGAVSVYLRSRFSDDLVATSLSFVVPFVAYVAAEEAGASGVIAVVTAGLFIGHESAKRFSARSRLMERVNWRTIQFVLENGVFLLMGYQLKEFATDVIDDGYGLESTAWIGLLLVGVLLVVRLAFVFPLIGLLRLRRRWIFDRHDRLGRKAEALQQELEELRPTWHDVEERSRRIGERHRRRQADLEFLRREGLTWRGGAVIGWAGMRGVVTVAAAQSLPSSTPYRSELILIAFLVAVVTLGIGGLTLPGLIRLLRMRPDGAEQRAAEREQLMDEITRATLDRLDAPAVLSEDAEAPPAEVDAEALELVKREVTALGRITKLRYARRADSKTLQVRRLRRIALEAQRAALLDARSSGVYSSETIAEIEAILDSVELRDLGR